MYENLQERTAAINKAVDEGDFEKVHEAQNTPVRWCGLETFVDLPDYLVGITVPCNRPAGHHASFAHRFTWTWDA